MQHSRTRTAWVLTALASGAAVLLSACSAQADLRRAELAALAVQLPGEYRNPRQELSIVRLPAPMVGDQVFYVRETMADDSRRVISERIWSLDVVAGARILAVAYALDEPERWRGGAASPELFRSLLMRDLRSLPGCELEWTKDPRGFTAKGISAFCPQSWRLEGDELSFSDQASAAGTIGGAIPPGGKDLYFHFRRAVGARR
ncbi:MAG: hypothetical protein KGJ52_07430 [Gammaproteobacteria bacterium]|nr:hypothetical protein [Gammaproteobacteria bacterium]